MSKQRKIVLLGEGVHQHTLYGDFDANEHMEDFGTVTVNKETDLVHEHPSRSFGEHHVLKMETGVWKQGLQVEYNPFTNSVSRVWD